MYGLSPPYAVYSVTEAHTITITRDTAMHIPCGILSNSNTSASDSFVSRNATLSKADLGSKCLTTAHMLRPVHPTLITYTASMRPGKLLCPTESSVGSRSTS